MKQQMAVWMQPCFAQDWWLRGDRRTDLFSPWKCERRKLSDFKKKKKSWCIPFISKGITTLRQRDCTETLSFGTPGSISGVAAEGGMAGLPVSAPRRRVRPERRGASPADSVDRRPDGPLNDTESAGWHPDARSAPEQAVPEKPEAWP